jgi:hypothetical protein
LHNREKYDIQAKFAEDRSQIQKEKEQFLSEKIGFKEAVTRDTLLYDGLIIDGGSPSRNPSMEACRSHSTAPTEERKNGVTISAKHSAGSVGPKRRNCPNRNLENQGIGLRM